MAKKWDDKWTDYAKEYTEKIAHNSSISWLNNNIKSLILLSDIGLSGTVTIIKEFDSEYRKISSKSFEKRINRITKPKFFDLVRFFILDYICVIADNEEITSQLVALNITIEEFQKEVLNILKFTDKEKDLYAFFLKKKDTIYHTKVLLENIGLKEESNNEVMVYGIEEYKKEVYKQMDENILSEIKKASAN